MLRHWLNVFSEELPGYSVHVCVSSSLSVSLGARFNRSLFFLTEALLRLSEAPAALEALDWNCSAATSLLRGPLLSPGHLMVLATVDPSDRFLPVSVPVLRFAERLSALKRQIRPQTITPQS